MSHPAHRCMDFDRVGNKLKRCGAPRHRVRRGWLRLDPEIAPAGFTCKRHAVLVLAEAHEADRCMQK